MPRCSCGLLLVTLSLRAWTVAAQERSPVRPDLVTDRPDFTESSDVVIPGLVQFESGLTYEADTRDGVRTRNLSVPGALLRIGVAPRVELRLGGDGFLWQSIGELSATGFSDVEVGVKIRLLDQQRAGIDLALIPMASLPLGGDGFTSGGIDPTLKVTWARSVPAGFDVSGNVNLASVTDEAGRFTQRAVSVSVGHDLFGRWGAFVEGYAFTPMERDAPAGVTLNGGVTCAVGRDLQFDVEMGKGVTAAAPDWFVGFGFVARGAARK